MNMKRGLFDNNDEDTVTAQKLCLFNVNNLLSKKVKLYSIHITDQTNLLMQSILRGQNTYYTNRNFNLTDTITKTNNYFF